MKRLFSTKKKVAAAAGAVAMVLAGAGAAFAYFTSTGNGTGAGTVGSANTWNVTTATAGGPMYPGTSTGDETVTVTIKNVGHGYQELNAFTISVADSGGNPWTGSTTSFPSENGCSTGDFALGGQSAAGSYTVSSLADDLAPQASYVTTVNLHMLDTNVPQDNCQGLTTVPLYVSAS